MKIAMRRGHQRTGADGCAVGILNEIDVAEDYYKRAMEKFRQLGHEVLDCTPPEANRSLSDSLSYGINKANSWGADIFISCHANNAYDSYNGAIGCEVIYHKNSSKGKEYAVSIERELASIGFKSRGAKADVRGLAEIKRTNMPAVIVEPFFLEATEDVALYKKVGGEGIANAIVKGVTGETSNAKGESTQKPQENNSSSSTKEYAQRGNATVLVDKLNVRTNPSVNAQIVSSYTKGETIYNYDRVYEADGYRWIRYLAYSGNYRYVAVRELSTNKRYANCY